MVEELIKRRTLLENDHLCSCQSTASQMRLIEKVITKKRYSKSRVCFTLRLPLCTAICLGGDCATAIGQVIGKRRSPRLRDFFVEINLIQFLHLYSFMLLFNLNHRLIACHIFYSYQLESDFKPIDRWSWWNRVAIIWLVIFIVAFIVSSAAELCDSAPTLLCMLTMPLHHVRIIAFRLCSVCCDDNDDDFFSQPIREMNLV